MRSVSMMIFLGFFWFKKLPSGAAFPETIRLRAAPVMPQVGGRRFVATDVAGDGAGAEISCKVDDGDCGFRGNDEASGSLGKVLRMTFASRGQQTCQQEMIRSVLFAKLVQQEEADEPADASRRNRKNETAEFAPISRSDLLTTISSSHRSRTNRYTLPDFHQASGTRRFLRERRCLQCTEIHTWFWHSQEFNV